jgi:hypothetical protein
MEKATKMYADMSREDREKMMAAQCYKVVTQDFSRTLSETTWTPKKADTLKTL